MSDIAKVLVFGAGGVGAMAAFALEKNDQALVTVVARSSYETIVVQGYTIYSVDHGSIKGWRPHEVFATIPQADDGAPFDFIVVATKNIPDVPPALTSLITSAVTPGHTAIVLLQNGLNIEVPFQTAFPANPIVSATSFIGATEGPKATIRHDVHDEIFVGPFECPELPASTVTSVAERFASLYGTCTAVSCSFKPDTRYWRWRKLLYNASYNSVAAITGLDVSTMRFSEHIIDSLIRPIMLEVLAIASAEGVELDHDLIEQTIVVDPYDTFFLPSMGQDALHGNLVEFENIIGEPLRTAMQLGVPAPTLQVVYSLLKAKQWITLRNHGQFTIPQTSTADMRYG